MRVGTDTSKFPGARENGPHWTLDKISELGLDGAFFRSALELSPTLDAGELGEIAAHATGLGLYLEVGTAKVNPFATPEAPEIRRLGDGDYLLGMRRIIEALAGAGIRELWTATANYQFKIQGLYACDRFRTDVSWADQLAATAGVLVSLAPILRDHGCHLNIETHEEITSFEVVRLVEEAGPDAFGITFDTANVLVRCEDPVAAAHRVAPYTRQSHVRDVALAFTEDGIGRFLAPAGQGVIDWPALLAPLVEHAPDATLSIEGIIHGRAEMPLFVDDPVWRAGHPDLTLDEFAEVHRLTRSYAGRADLAALRAPTSSDEELAFITDSVAYLRTVLTTLGSPA
ncbi:sugar phosphate isomerase/epimerase [Actinoplanes lutulentus]|uniref:Sugar phosphate isomerase/epimerase n=1 Tax=Actinoplanes lutulentus TaxID=1287878 RepID=A0A327ZA95_9ACTN|nr:sugar phosphate isomerase/epimerase [Actinoplanes lutulentus]MBB2947218.1 sugar phosphate isomerase/epimerase [Actinoplanes lutulentus]RAK36493.1 sugar phosphate isomerase/epimerase [Actinoplanes lutulentus]